MFLFVLFISYGVRACSIKTKGKFYDARKCFFRNEYPFFDERKHD